MTSKRIDTVKELYASILTNDKDLENKLRYDAVKSASLKTLEAALIDDFPPELKKTILLLKEKLNSLLLHSNKPWNRPEVKLLLEEFDKIKYTDARLNAIKEKIHQDDLLQGKIKNIKDTKILEKLPGFSLSDKNLEIATDPINLTKEEKEIAIDEEKKKIKELLLKGVGWNDNEMKSIRNKIKRILGGDIDQDEFLKPVSRLKPEQEGLQESKKSILPFVKKLQTLRAHGKTFDDPEINNIIKTLENLNYNFPELMSVNDKNIIDELISQYNKFHSGSMQETYPSSKKTEPHKETLDEALNKLQPELQEDILEVDEDGTIKKFVPKNKLEINKRIKDLLEKYKNNELSIEEAISEWKEIDPKESLMVIKNKLSIAKPLETSLEKQLINPMGNRQEIAQEIISKQTSLLSKDTQKTLSLLSDDFIIDAISPQAAMLKLETLQTELDNIFGEKYKSVLGELDSFHKNITSLQESHTSTEVLNKEIKESFRKLSFEAKSLIELAKKFTEKTLIEIEPKDIMELEEFAKSKFKKTEEEIKKYYENIAKIKNTMAPDDSVSTEPLDKDYLYSKAPSEFPSPGTIIGEEITEVDGQTVVKKIYAPENRLFVRCPRGHYSSYWGREKDTNKLTPRVKCEHCSEPISFEFYKNKLSELKTDVETFVDKAIEKIKNDSSLSPQESAQKINKLNEIIETNNFAPITEKIKEARIRRLEKEQSRLKDLLNKKKISLSEFKKESKKISDEIDNIDLLTDQRSLQFQMSALSPVPYSELELNVRSKGSWGIGDKSTTPKEIVEVSAKKAPGESERFIAEKTLDRLNVKADQDGNPILEVTPFGMSPLPLEKKDYVFFALSDILKKINAQGRTKLFEQLLNEQKIKNDFLHGSISKEEAEEKLSSFYLTSGQEKEEGSSEKRAKETLIKEQYKYKKLNYDEALSELEDLGIDLETAKLKLNTTPQTTTLPTKDDYKPIKEGYIRYREEGRPFKTKEQSEFAPLAIWNLKKIMPALEDRIEFVETVVKPKQKTLDIAAKIKDLLISKNAILREKAKKESDLWKGNAEKMEKGKKILGAIKANRNLFNKLVSYKEKQNQRPGLENELIKYRNEVKRKVDEVWPEKEKEIINLLNKKKDLKGTGLPKREYLKQISEIDSEIEKIKGSVISEEEKLLLEGLKIDPELQKSLIHTALDWNDFQQKYNLPLKEINSKLEKLNLSLERIKEGQGETKPPQKEVVKELSSIEDLLTELTGKDDESSPETFSDLLEVFQIMEDSISEEPKEDLLEKEASLKRYERIISLAMSCLE